MMRRGIFLVVALCSVLFFAHGALAQAVPSGANGLFIDWSTNTYIPSNYTGKALPTGHSQVMAWIVLFSNGKPVDLSLYSVRWYSNNAFVQSGQGLQEVTMPLPSQTGQIVTIQARVQDPSGNLLVANAQVPVVDPKVMVATDYPSNTFTGSSATVTAEPYFFNVTDPSLLSYTWSVNGQTAASAENPEQLVISIPASTPSGSQFHIKLTVANASDKTSGNVNTTLVYQHL